MTLLIFWSAGFAAPSRAAPELLLAQAYRGGIDLKAYLASEKLDGVRGCWDGSRLWTRGGNPVAAPAWFVAALPPVPLDGELWMGRGRFEPTSAAVRRQVPDEAEWRHIRFMVFELPDGEGGFSERAERIRDLVAEAGVPWLQAVEQFPIDDARTLDRRLREVVRAGGEGLMLHKADAGYVTGRSDVLLKVKLWHDAEAVVTGHVAGSGKYAGQLGALRVRTADGREFSLGTGFSDDQRRVPPPVGSTVTYRYREITANGLPRFARFWRVRPAE